MIWSYLRSKVRESILAGVSDALVEIEGGGTDCHDNGAGDALALLRAKLTPALPAPPAGVPATASTPAPDATAPEEVPTAGRNGRGRQRAAATA